MIGCLPTQAVAFLAVFIYATHATQAIAFGWKPGLTVSMLNHAIPIGEVANKITPSSCIFCGIFLPKNIKIEQCSKTTKLQLMKDGDVLF